MNSEILSRSLGVLLTRRLSVLEYQEWGREDRLDQDRWERVGNKIEEVWNPSLGMCPWASSSTLVSSSVKSEEEFLQKLLRGVNWMKHVKAG